MLLILVGLLLWIPAVKGWGTLWTVLARRLEPGPAQPADAATGDPPAGDLISPLFGLALLTAISTVINFFAPVTPLITTAALLIGWVLLVVRLRRPHRIDAWPWLAGLGAFWLVIIALFASGSAANLFDTGFYHLQAIRWTEISRVPLGAGNLFSRLAFNDSWFQLAALLNLPVGSGPAPAGASLFLISGVLTWFLLMAASQAALALFKSGEWSRHALFLAAALIVPWTAVNPIYLSSASPDWAVVVLALAAVYVAIQALDGRLTPTVALAALLFLASYGVTVKLSAATLILLAAPVLVFARWQDERQPVRWRALALCAAGFGVAFVAPWLMRTVLLSGCAIYPVAATCLYSLPWHMPQPVVREEMRWVMAWARWADHPPDQVLANWDWLRPWLQHIRRDGQLRRSAELLIIGLAALWLPLGVAGQPRARLAFLWLSLPMAAGMVYWFATAPDVRFGAGYFWGLGLWALAAGLYRLHQAGSGARLARAALWLGLALVVILFARSALALKPRLLETLRNQPALADWPAIPLAPVDPHLAVDGYAINVPETGAQCWLSAPPCTPYLDGNLRVQRDANGQARMFYLP
jgi:hypothetical protein